MRDPPMMFWHIAGALSLNYWLVPVPNAHWTIDEMTVPIDEVIAVMAKALGVDTDKVRHWCTFNQ